MSSPQVEAGQYLIDLGIVSDCGDSRTTVEIAQAFGYCLLDATAVEIGTDDPEDGI